MSPKSASPLEEPTNEANLVHNAMRQLWEDTYDTGYDEDLLSQLARLLFMKRKRVESADASQLGLAFASQEETCRTIRNVLELRQSYLKSKGIENLRHVLTNDERAELTKRARADYEDLEEQRVLQHTDVEKGKAKGKGWRSKEATGRGRGKGRGAPQPATGSLPAFLRAQKRKRWHQHLQQVCGTKEIWETLAFTGRFDADILREALRSTEQDGDAEEETQDAGQQQRRRLLHAQAEARASYNEGRRLAGQRDAHWDRLRGASQPAREAGSSEGAPSLTSWQENLLQRWDSGELLRDKNSAVAAWGHGRLRSADGQVLDIGGSTGGGSRRIIDGWTPPDWREFLRQSDTMQQFLSHSDTA